MAGRSIVVHAAPFSVPQLRRNVPIDQRSIAKTRQQFQLSESSMQESKTLRRRVTRASVLQKLLQLLRAAFLVDLSPSVLVP